MTLKLNGSSSGYTAINAPAAAGSNTLVLPTTNGSAGQVLQTDGSGNLSWVTVTSADNTPAFNAYMNADVSIGHDSLHKVVFQAEDFDTDNAYDTSNGKFTVPSGKGGKYMLSAQIVVDDVDSGGERMEFYPYINGSQPDDMQQSWSNYPPNSGQMAGSSLNGVYTLAAGDYMELYAYQTAGQTEHLQHNMCWWSMFRLAGV
jgi:hypothetical protein